MWLRFISVIALITKRNHLAYLFADLLSVPTPSRMSAANMFGHHVLCLPLYLAYLSSDCDHVVPDEFSCHLPSHSLSSFLLFSWTLFISPSHFNTHSLRKKWSVYDHTGRTTSKSSDFAYSLQPFLQWLPPSQPFYLVLCLTLKGACRRDA